MLTFLHEFTILLILALLALASSGHCQLKLETPLLNLRILSYPQFCYVLIMLFLAFFTFLGLELLMPMYVQQVLLLSATVAGLVLFPTSVLQAIASPLLGLLLDKKGGRTIALPAIVLMLTGIASLFFYMDSNSHPWIIAIMFVVLALSITCAITCETHALNSLPRKYYPPPWYCHDYHHYPYFRGDWWLILDRT